MLNLSIYFLFIACNPQEGHRGASGNINEAMKLGVFIAKYSVTSNPYKINDSLQISVQEAWLEKKWVYSKDVNKIIIIDGYQLCVNTESQDIKGLDIRWTIGINGEKYIRSSGINSLMSDFVSVPQDDRIEYLVQKGNNLSDTGEKEIIGKFVLVRQ